MLSAGLQQLGFLFYRQFLISVMLMKKRQLSAKFFTSFTMASKSRRCLNDPNGFCYIYGEYTDFKRIQKLKFK
jgi:hypothetical protein